MKLYKLSLIWVLFSAVLFGCADEKEESLKTISGKITDSNTGRGVPSVSVSTGKSLTQTDNNGVYLLSDLKSGQYVLTFEKTGYETEQLATTIMGRDVIVDCALNPLPGESNRSISGRVTNSETGAPIRSATVSIGTSNTTTDSNGLYILSNLQPREHTVTFSASGYETRLLVTTIAGQNVTLNCSLTPTSSSATTVVDDFIAISDGIYYYFKPSSNTKKYYWTHYKSSSLPSSEATIIEKLFSDGVEAEVSDSFNEGYSYDLDANTKYTICIIALDANNKYGNIVKKEISTKSSQNQPLAVITVNSISSVGVLNYSMVRNSYCSSYVLKGYHNLTSAGMSYPDIVWAASCYDDYKVSKNIYTQNQANTTWSGWDNNCIIISLGFTSSEVSGGVISKQYFSTGKANSDSQTRSSSLNKQEGKSSFNKNLLKVNPFGK